MTTPTTPDEATYKRLSGLFVDVTRSTQTLYTGFLSLNDAKSAAQVQLVWGKKDFVNNSTIKYHTQYHVAGLNGSEQPRIDKGLVPSNWDVALTSISPSKRYVVTLKFDKGADGVTEGVFNVFDQGVLSHTFKAPKSLHGTVYTGEREGGLTWSHDETKIAYIAEKKVAEGTAFWENVNSAKKKTDGSEKTDDKEKAVLPGSKFEFQDDWGEQYVGKKTGAIFIATLSTGEIEEVKGVPSNLTCADVCFTPGDSGLVFAGTEVDNPKRLGIVYCYNRPIALYHVALSKDADSVVTKLAINPADDASELIASHRSPRFSPCGTKLAFLATRDVVTHNTCSLLAVMDWTTKQTTTLIDVVYEPEPGYTQNPTTAFNGLFCGSLAKTCWSSDGRYIFFSTQLGARTVWKYVDVQTKRIMNPAYIDGAVTGAESVLDRAGDDWFLVTTSSPVRPPSVFLVQLDLATGKYAADRTPIAVVDQKGLSTHIGDWKILSVPTSVSDGPASKKPQPPHTAELNDALLPQVTSSSDFEAMIWLPSTDAPKDGYPVILDVHGGPHGTSPVMYRVMYDYLVALGFAIVSINYRGSTGYGLRPLESLIGRVGTQDVYDCHYGLIHVLETSGLPLDKSRVHCSGGSHGGFLVAHFITQFPGFYRSTVARNPVVNIASQFFTSDIPDWGLAITGVARFDAVATTQALQRQAKNKQLAPLSAATRAAILTKWWSHSPMSNAIGDVTTPVLFGIGGKDRRVPPTQGLEFRDALTSVGVKTRTLWYPEDNHPLDTLAAFGDFSVNWGAWLLEHS